MPCGVAACPPPRHHGCHNSPIWRPAGAGCHAAPQQNTSRQRGNLLISCLDREILQSSQCSDRSVFQAVSSPSKEMIEQPRMAGLLPRPLPLSENMAASAALLARLTAARPAFPFPPSPFLSGGKTLPGMPPMLAQLPQFPDIRARLLGLQFPQRQESPPQFSPPGFLGGFNFSRDGSDSPVDGELFNILMS